MMWVGSAREMIGSVKCGLRSVCAILTVLIVSSAGAASLQRPLDTIAERAKPCMTCHGEQGRATSQGYFPRIAGKPRGYLLNQLQNFRDGRRNYPLMVHLVEHLTDEYLAEIADYFAALDLPYPPPAATQATAQTLARGETLVRRGEPARDMPACAACHGDALMGTEPYIPGLLGLSRDYLYGQLGFWKSGERRAHAPDCMATIASRLTVQDIDAVSAWLAGQRLRGSAQASDSPSQRRPLSCGSVRSEAPDRARP